MAKAQLLYRDGGRAFLSGVLDFDTVADLVSFGSDSPGFASSNCWP